MKHIAAPMIGGVITSTLMGLLVYPAIFYLWPPGDCLAEPQRVNATAHL